MQVTDRQERLMEISTDSDLQNAIEELQKKKEMQEVIISDSFDDIKESLKPGNIVRSVFHKVTDGQDAVSLGLKVGGTIAAAIVTKKLISKYHHQNDELEVKKETKDNSSFMGNFLRTTASNILLSNIPVMKAWVVATYENLFSDKETRIINKKDNDGR